VTDLRVSGVYKAFDQTPVIQGVDLNVPSGTITAILGPSGCGKTTLLRLIAGFDNPDAGVISLGAQLLYVERRSVPPEQRRIGFVVQEGALFPHLTVGGNITFGLTRGSRADEATVDQLLKLVGLEPEFTARFPHQLSGGQQQRVALARALAPQPRVILLDEPFSSLDSQLRESTRRAILQSLTVTGTTTIMVTHDQAEALSMADQVAVMHAGRFIDVGPPTTVYRQPSSPESARATGAVIIVPATITDRIAECELGRALVYDDTPAGACEIMVRPEQLVLSPAEAPSGVLARVRDVIFYGHEAVVQLELPGGSAVLARSTGFQAPSNDTLVKVHIDGLVHAFPE
jgi:iron(III) transport system ATP-binding protein